MRKYDGEPAIWDSVNGCVHEWGNELVKLAAHHAGETNPGKEGYTKNKEQWASTQGNFCRLCGAWQGQLGIEPTPELFISHLCGIFDLTKRVLKKTGTLWVVLDDSYAGGKGQSGSRGADFQEDRYEKGESLNRSYQTLGGAKETKPTDGKIGVPAKSLIGIPERFVLEMLNRGWIRRNTIIWHKNNPMPESAKDRFTSDFEYLYLFSQQQDYYFEQQFEQYTAPLDRWGGDNLVDNGNSQWSNGTGQPLYRDRNLRPNPQGRNKRCVWTINTVPNPVKGHFATFPPKLIETPIRAGCPQYICSKCGKPRVKIYESHGVNTSNEEKIKELQARGIPRTTANLYATKERGTSSFIGYSSCPCGAEFKPGVVMDILAGSGTTLQVALTLGRRSIGIDSSEKYCRLATKRKAQPGMGE